MRLVITIDLEHDAFRPDAAPEVRRILTDYMETIAHVAGCESDAQCAGARLYDWNGNSCGSVRVED